MAITTIDGALGGMTVPADFAKNVTGTMVAGRPHSTWLLAGIPGAGAAPTSGVINGAVLSGTTATTSGILYFQNPISGSTYVARFQGQATIAGTLVLCDRLWHNSITGTTLTGQQYFDAAVIPPRDNDGNIDGEGVYAGVEVMVATGAGTPTLTVEYVNVDGLSGRTATNIVATVASSIAGSFYPIGLQAGDVGMQRAYSYRQSVTWTQGTVSVVLYRPIARLELTAANTPNAIDIVTGGFQKVYNNSNLFLLFYPSTTTTSNISGQVIFTQG